MILCGKCGRHHSSSDEVRACYGLKPTSRPTSKSKRKPTSKSKRTTTSRPSSGSKVPPRTGRSSKSGQVWDAPVDPEGAKRATPKFDKENREPYN